MAARPRYVVEICHANFRMPRKGYPTSIAHEFASRIRAESFAREIARRLPRETEDGCPLSWVLVSSLAVTEGTRASTGRAWCYLAYDPGAILVKLHEIGRGYYGASCAKCGTSMEALHA